MTHVKEFKILTLIYKNHMIATIKKLTRVTRMTATAIDHVSF